MWGYKGNEAYIPFMIFCRWLGKKIGIYEIRTTITNDSYRHHNWHYTIYTHKTGSPIVYIFVRTPRRVPQLCGICPDVRQSVLPFRSDFCPDSRQTSPYIIRGPATGNRSGGGGKLSLFRGGPIKPLILLRCLYGQNNHTTNTTV